MSLKLGNVNINKIFLGSTLINKVYLGSSLIYPNGTPPPSGNLLDGFEAIASSDPWISSGYSWYDGTFTAPTVTRTSSNVTQGSFSWRLQDTEVFGGAQLAAGNPFFGGAIIDLSSYTYLKIDSFGATIPAGTRIVLTVVDGSFTGGSATTVNGFTGSTTLELDLTSLGIDLSDILILIGVENDGVTPEGAFDVYFDNLRAE